MANELIGKRIAIVVTDGFEQDELVKPKEALVQAGAEADIVSPNSDKVRGWKYTDWGDEFPVDTQIASADFNNYDGLMLPGGQINPDNLRMDKSVVQFVQSFVRTVNRSPRFVTVRLH
jgi:protease I